MYIVYQINKKTAKKRFLYFNDVFIYLKHRLIENIFKKKLT